MWKIELASSCDSIIKNGLKALQICNKNVYLNIYVLLKILVTLPVSTTTPKQSVNIKKVEIVF